MQEYQQYRQLENKLLSKIHEAEQITHQIRLVKKEQQALHLLRWAVVADEATALIHMAEEILTEAQLQRLQRRVNQNEPGRWQRYRDNNQRFKHITHQPPEA